MQMMGMTKDTNHLFAKILRFFKYTFSVRMILGGPQYTDHQKEFATTTATNIINTYHPLLFCQQTLLKGRQLQPNIADLKA